jgi:hypothetical protein
VGASGWDYVTPYRGTVEQSLKALHEQVFQADFGDDDAYHDVEDLWRDVEFMGEEGAHSILDIRRVVHTTVAPSSNDIEDYGTLRPLAEDRVAHHFGTVRPTPDQFTQALARASAGLGSGTLRDECRMRWTGLYLLLYAGPEPTHVGIFGFSGD